MNLNRQSLADVIPEYGMKYWDDAEIMFLLPFEFFAGFKQNEIDNQNVAIFINAAERDAWVNESTGREILTEEEAWARLNVEDSFEQTLCKYWWDEGNNRIRWAGPIDWGDSQPIGDDTD